MSRIVPVLTVLLLALASPAGAKELEEVAVCGADGCTDVTGRATHAVLDGMPTDQTARPSEPHFRIRLAIGDGRRIFERFAMRWFPERRLLRHMDGIWLRTTAASQEELELLTDGREPLGEGGRVPVSAREEDEEDGGGPMALAIGTPAAAAAAGAAILLTRRRRRR